MIKVEDECVGPCPQGCSGYCQYRNVLHLYCDKCGCSVDALYTGNDKYDELCEDCAYDEMKSSLEECDFDELRDYFGYTEVTDYE